MEQMHIEKPDSLNDGSLFTFTEEEYERLKELLYPPLLETSEKLKQMWGE